MGGSTSRSIAIGGSPSASADSRTAPGMLARPAWVLRTMGSRL